MAIPLFLAMTGDDIRKNLPLPPKIAWMSCHYSPAGAGLTDLPRYLPPGSMLILDDRIPLEGHDPELVSAQLYQVVQELNCQRVLLDFQRPGGDAVAAQVLRQLDCPVGMTLPYAQELACPVFLPPVPLPLPICEYLRPWAEREIWLEAAMDGATITVTAEGSHLSPVPFPDFPESAHHDKDLCCHYRIDKMAEEIRFSLFRTRQDVQDLLERASSNVTLSVGLFQELMPPNR